jgi:hypothetical protein
MKQANGTRDNGKTVEGIGTKMRDYGTITEDNGKTMQSSGKMVVNRTISRSYHNANRSKKVST